MQQNITFKKAWDGSQTDCLQCSLRSSALFSGLTENDFKLLHEPVEQLTLDVGESLYKVGEAGHHLFTIREGLIKLVQYLPDGNQRIVRLVKSADVLGLEMMVGSHYEHEAIVVRSAQLCRYPVEAVTRLSQQNPVLHKDLMKRWQKALIGADLWLTKLSSGQAKKRMAHLLLLLAEGEESSHCSLFSREDIGSILSITTETASRTLSEFKRLSLIDEISPNKFSVDISGLQVIISS